jgi:hypothetical protein
VLDPGDRVRLARGILTAEEQSRASAPLHQREQILREDR